jgi:soluble lytic murein transglycosylase
MTCRWTLFTGFVLALLAPGTALADQPASDDTLRQQRETYQHAQKALTAGQISRFNKLRGQLDEYPLAMYLDYQKLSRRLYTLPSKGVEDFLTNYPDSLLARRLTNAWLLQLGKNRRWQEYLQYYQPAISTTRQQCYYLRARWNTGEKEAALQETGKLWLVGKSQPKACDPLFIEWIDAGYATPELAWRRFELAMQSGQVSLARYLKRFLDKPRQQLADHYIKAHYSPQLLARKSRYQKAEFEPVILHGLKRLLRYDLEETIELWRHYQRVYQFNPNDIEALESRLAVKLAGQSNTALLEWLAEIDPEAGKSYLLEKRLTAAIALGRWEEVNRWIQKLPGHLANKQKWQYWYAVASGETGQDYVAQPIYQALAQQRSYYGFLAADELKLPYQMQDMPIRSEPAILAAVQSNPAIQRARELYLLDQKMDARREWYHAIQNLTDKEIIAAGSIALEWGWHLQSVLAMVHAEYWHDLERRFPLPYRELMQQATRETGIDTNYLYAVARQESAFGERAHSTAGAMGLMQILPATAKQTARKAGIPYRNRYELLEPKKNIKLGSIYLGQLLADFNNNRVLASAAYNAGPHRVRRWLTRHENEMPLTNWIETIPFKETRQYVKNILAFSVIYAYRHGEKQALIQPHELAVAGYKSQTLAKAH